MLKSLLKKQLLELNQFYFQDRKKGKRRSKGGTAGMILLFLVIFIFIAVAFYGISSGLGSVLITPGFMSGNATEWLYFALMGLLALALGTFGSVFNTYSGLYRAKDNELLLSLPIPPAMLLFVRMTGVYLMSLLYVAIAWVPCVIRYWVVKIPTAPQIVASVLLTFFITLLVTVLTCILGWVVALCAGKTKGKNFLTVIISLAFFAVYYYVCFRASALLQALVNNAQQIGEVIRGWIFPIYKLGQAAAGNMVAFLIFAGITVGLFFLCYYVMSRTYIRMITTNKGSKKTEYKREQTVKATDCASALLRKERMRFTGSSVYMLNCGLGLVILIVLAVLALIKADVVRAYLDAFASIIPLFGACIPIMASIAVCILISMSSISGPSISLEGKNLWILQSLPVSGWDILKAKEKFHVILNIIPALVAVICFSVVVGTDFSIMILGIALVWVYTWFTADLGLILNLKFPNLTWTQETVAVKQSISVLIVLFGGWGISVLMLLGGMLFAYLGNPTLWLVICVVVIALLYRLMHRWLQTKGAVKLESL